MSALFGGVFIGFGCAISYIGGGSTGGVDVIALSLSKYIKRAKSSTMIFIVDATIIILGFIFNKEHDIAVTLDGVLSAFIGALVIERVLTGSNSSFVAFIVSEKALEITNDVIEKLDRTTSIIDCIGGYTKDNKNLIMVSYTIRQYNKLREIVAFNDKKAFMTIHKAYEISGEGFKEL